ncbi:hypothetical protein [Streptomyces sp. NPDC046197]|uniref:hypothetical protein n=1 Tax=Streptomyces sp. NPDC046197 TaxID=3154337 RepID=UPI0033DF0653
MHAGSTLGAATVVALLAEVFQPGRREIGHDLRSLAVAAQGSRSDEKTVESLTDDFAEYQELIGLALENDGHRGGKPDALADYRRSTDLLRSQLLPAADTLVSSNNSAFDAEYSSAGSTLSTQLATVLALSVLSLAVLGVLQWYLALTFRRILSPVLPAATVCTLLAAILGTQLLSASADRLRVARHDAFDSVVALSRARAIAHDANADEGRHLLDPLRRDRYASSFLAKSQQLYGLNGAALPTYDAELSTTWQAYQTDHHDLRFTGEFRRELDTSPFPANAPRRRRQWSRTPSTSATTGRSTHCSRQARSARRPSSAWAGSRARPTPTSRRGWQPWTRWRASTVPTSRPPSPRAARR